jgi:2-iminoacetate synthase
MFSRQLPRWLQMAAVLDRATPPSPAVVTGLLEKAARGLILDAEEMTALLAGTRNDRSRRTILEFARHYRRPHDREILLLPPLYFSSICENRCKYCSFSADGSRLSLEEFGREVDALIGMGYRSIELVSSQDPAIYLKHAGFHPQRQRFRIHEVAKYFDLLHSRIGAQGGGMITSNIPPLDVTSMKRLRKAGLDCFLIWLETLHPDQYRRLHHAEGPKADHAFRLNSFERAFQAGMPHVAGAFLKGLYDWRHDAFLFYRLDAYLKEKYGHGFSIIGTPRLKGAFMKSRLVRDFQVSDPDYELNLALDRVLYDGILWQQTRESANRNRRFMQRYGAGVILTLTSCTAPGGYSAPPRARAQFPVHKQNLAQEVRRLEDLGFRLHFNWNSDTLTQFQRPTTSS